MFLPVCTSALGQMYLWKRVEISFEVLRVQFGHWNLCLLWGVEIMFFSSRISIPIPGTYNHSCLMVYFYIILYIDICMYVFDIGIYMLY